MNSFLTAVNAVLPFLLYLCFGYFIKAAGAADEAFLKKLNSMVFRCFFPVMMFCNIYHIDLKNRIRGSYILITVITLLALIGLLLLLVPLLVPGNPQRGVIIQAVYRSNFVLFALPMTERVFGEAGTGSAAVMIAVVVPIYNLAAVMILEFFNQELRDESAGQAQKHSFFRLLARNIFTNPLIMGAIAGAAALLIGLRLPGVVDQSVTAISDMTTPLALIILGGTLRFRAIGGNAKYLIPGLAAKMIVIPFLITVLTFRMPVTAIERFILLVMYGSPVAVASYAMAENMGGDGELAGQFVVLSTVLSVFTLFGWIFFYGQAGLL